MNTFPTARPDAPTPRPGALQRALRTVLRLGVALVTVVAILGLLLLGLLMTLGLLGWALIRGRKPPTAAFRATYQRARHRYQNAREDQVVDVATRVVPESEVK